MKKMFFLLIVLLGLLASCSDYTDENPAPDRTLIVFDNTKGICTAIVYSSHLRTEESKIAEIQAGQVSKEFEYAHGSSIPFFFSYNLNLLGINDSTINYISEFGQDQDYIRIDANRKNVIVIPSLAQIISSPDLLLSNNSYIFIQNNSSFSISFIRGIHVLLSDNFSDTGINQGERAQYTIKSTDNRTVSAYHLRENIKTVSFDGLVEFLPGHIYNFIYDGTNIYLFSFVKINLDNITKGSLNDPVNKTEVRFINNNDLSVSVYSDFPRRLKITDIAPHSHSNLQTNPNISGAPYYPVFNIVIDGISIPYNGGLIVTRIDAGKTAALPNVVYIPRLEELDVLELDKPLKDSAYIKIQNNTYSSISLRRGQSDLIPQDAMSILVNNSETALYIVNPGTATNYKVMKNRVDPVNFPDDITEFASGRLYSFNFDGTRLVLLVDRPLTLKEALSLSPPENINARSQDSGNIVLNWTKAGTENYYSIYRAEENPENLNSYNYLASTEKTSFTDNTVELGKTYYYRLSSQKDNLESNKSINYVSVFSEILLDFSTNNPPPIINIGPETPVRLIGQYPVIFNTNIVVTSRTTPLILEFENFGIQAQVDTAAIHSGSPVNLTISFRGKNNIVGGTGRTAANGAGQSGNVGAAAINVNGNVIISGGGDAIITGGAGTAGSNGTNYNIKAMEGSQQRGGNAGNGGGGGDGITASGLSLATAIGDITIKGGNGGSGGVGGSGRGTDGSGHMTASSGGNGGTGGVGGRGAVLTGNFSINLLLTLENAVISGGNGGVGGTGGAGGQGYGAASGRSNDNGGSGGSGGRGGKGGTAIYFTNENNIASGNLPNNLLIVQGGIGGKGGNGGRGGDARGSNIIGQQGRLGPGGSGGNGGDGGVAMRINTNPTIALLQIRTSNGGNGGTRGGDGTSYGNGVGGNHGARPVNVTNPNGNSGAVGPQIQW